MDAVRGPPLETIHILHMLFAAFHRDLSGHAFVAEGCKTPDQFPSATPYFEDGRALFQKRWPGAGLLPALIGALRIEPGQALVQGGVAIVENLPPIFRRRFPELSCQGCLQFHMLLYLAGTNSLRKPIVFAIPRDYILLNNHAIFSGGPVAKELKRKRSGNWRNAFPSLGGHRK